MGKYTIQQLAEILVKKNGLNEKEAQDFVVAIFEIVKEGLEQDKLVKIKGFGTFKIIDIDPRASINVNTGERVLIEGHQKITFTPDAVMKEMVNRPFSQFETVILNDGVDLSEIDRTYNFEPDNNTGVEESETEQDTQETQAHPQPRQPQLAAAQTRLTAPHPTIKQTFSNPPQIHNYEKVNNHRAVCSGRHPSAHHHRHSMGRQRPQQHGARVKRGRQGLG